jgi:hypothetical protein
VSYGEGFRSLDATANVATSAGAFPPNAPTTPQQNSAGAGPSIQEGATPYSKVRAAEVGFRVEASKKRYSVTLSAFETWVDNELVFEATSGGFTTEGPSLRRGIVASGIARPCDWLLASVSSSVSSATFTTLVPGVSHFVPNVPSVLVRADVSARGKLMVLSGRPITGRIGVGYTFLAGRHLTDTLVAPANNVLNAGGSLRYANVELGLDAFNVLDLRYADDAEYYVSNWSVTPGTRLASAATHLIAAPPLSVLGKLALYF